MHDPHPPRLPLPTTPYTPPYHIYSSTPPPCLSASDIPPPHPTPPILKPTTYPKLIHVRPPFYNPWFPGLYPTRVLLSEVRG
eukprot:520258-Hanusia_phi.AAC.3